MTNKRTRLIEQHETQVRPLYTDLRARLEAGRSAADAAWASKMSNSFKEAVTAVADGVRAFEIKSPEIQSEEDVTRLRSNFAAMLKSAASAIEPKVV